VSCEHTQEHLTAYLEGELEDAAGSAIRGHLRTCEGCRQLAADEAALRDGLRAMPSVDPPPSLWAGVQAKLALAEVADAERPSWRRAMARWAPVARTRAVGFGAALAAAAVMVVWWRTHLPAAEPVAPIVPPRAPDPAPVVLHSRQSPSPDDVTAELDAEAAQVTAVYERTVDDLIDRAGEAKWTDAQRSTFDTRVGELRGAAARATIGRPRQRVLRTLIRYVETAVARDVVALADTGGQP
jgi:Putative zinc-finger